MRRRISANKQAAGVSLFPFLAVLLCTMGALIVVLVVIARQAHIQVAEAARREAASSAGSELAAKGEELEWRISELKRSREDTQKLLNDKQVELSHIEDHTRRLRDQLEELEEARVHFSELAAGDLKEAEELKKKLARLRIDADRTKREVDDLRRNGGGNGESYAIIPYHGPSETHRRPIYIECRNDSLVLQPEGIVLSEFDFTIDLGPSNPLAAALRAAKEYHIRNQLSGKGAAGTPYPLFLVRPDGIMMWYVGRAAIASWGSDFGYELVGADWNFEFPPVEPMLKMSMNQAVEEGRIRQQYLARAAPRMTHGGGGTFRAARGGGLVQVDGSPMGRGNGGRRGFGRPPGIRGRRNGGGSQGGGPSGSGLIDGSAGPTTEGPIHSIDGDDNPYLSALGPGGAGGNVSRPSDRGSTGSFAGHSAMPGAAAPGGLGSAGSAGSSALAGGPYPPGSPGSSGWRGGGNAGGSPFSDPTASALGKGGNGRSPGGGGTGSAPFGAGGAGAGRGNGRSPNQLAMGGGEGSGMYPGSKDGTLPGGIGQSGSGTTGSGTTGNRYGGSGGNRGLGNGSANGLGDGQAAGATGTSNGLSVDKKGSPFAGQTGNAALAGSGNGVAGGSPTATAARNGGPALGAANGTPTNSTLVNGTPASGTAAVGTAYRGQRAGGSRTSATTNSGSGTSDLANADPNSASANAGASIAASPNGYAGATVVDNGQASGDNSAAASRYSGTAGNATSGSFTGVDSGGAAGGTSSRGSGGNSASASRAGRSNSYTGNPNTNFSSSQVSSYNSSLSNSSSSGQQSPFGGSASSASSMSSPMMGGMPSPSMNFGQQAQAQENRRHRQREKNWANPDASTMNVPIERPIRVVCDADHLTLLPEGRGKQAMRVIPFKGQTYESVDDLVGAVWDRIDSWGTAGRGMYWRPKLQMEIEPGGQRRYTELQALLADSGFDVHGKPRRRVLGDRRVGRK